MPSNWLIIVTLWLVFVLLSSNWMTLGRGSTLIMQIVVSLALLAVGLYVIVSKDYQTADTNWAYGIVGTIIGYWLKGK